MIPAPKRRWFRFSLRTMFVVVTVVGVWLGWQLKIVRERQQVRKAIQDNGAIMWTLAEAESLGWTKADGVFQIPFWRRWLGDESFQSIIWENNSSLETFNRLRQLFPEAFIHIGAEFPEIGPGDPPRETLYDAPARIQQNGPGLPAIY